MKRLKFTKEQIKEKIEQKKREREKEEQLAKEKRQKFTKEQLRLRLEHKKQVREKEAQLAEEQRRKSHEAYLRRGKLSSVHKYAVKEERLRQHELRMERHERKRRIDQAMQHIGSDFKRVETEILSAFREKHRIGPGVELSLDRETGRIRAKQVLTMGADGVARGQLLEKVAEPTKEQLKEKEESNGGTRGSEGEGSESADLQDGDNIGGGGIVESGGDKKCNGHEGSGLGKGD